MSSLFACPVFSAWYDDGAFCYKKKCAVDRDWPPPNMQCCSGCAEREMIPYEADTSASEGGCHQQTNSMCYSLTCSIPETAIRTGPCQCQSDAWHLNVCLQSFTYARASSLNFENQLLRLQLKILENVADTWAAAHKPTACVASNISKYHIIV